MATDKTCRQLPLRQVARAAPSPPTPASTCHSRRAPAPLRSIGSVEPPRQTLCHAFTAPSNPTSPHRNGNAADNQMCGVKGASRPPPVAAATVEVCYGAPTTVLPTARSGLNTAMAAAAAADAAVEFAARRGQHVPTGPSCAAAAVRCGRSGRGAPASRVGALPPAPATPSRAAAATVATATAAAACPRRRRRKLS